MTAQQRTTIARIEASHESQRVSCELNSRPALTPEAIEANVLIAVQVKIDEGRMDEARALWREYRDSQKASN